MSIESIIPDALETLGIGASIDQARVISSDQSQQVISIALSDGSKRIAKLTDSNSSDRLHAEADGLNALHAPGHLLVPHCEPVVETSNSTVLIMDQLSSSHGASDSVWEQFANDLAAHHLADHGSRYGWHRDNYIGATPQINTWCNDWVEFNAIHRLGYQLKLAQKSLDRTISAQVERVIDRLDTLIPRSPHPALLHGDLWSGNALATPSRIGVIDPAVYVGDAWADIAMLTLFGSPPNVFMRVYTDALGDTENTSERVLVYQLYHMLNHFNLFGSSYAGSVSQICSRLM